MSKHESNPFGVYVRREREAHGMSQRDLAKVMNLSHQHIGDLEVGRRKPTVELALRMAAALDRPAEELLQRALQTRVPKEFRVLVSFYE